MVTQLVHAAARKRAARRGGLCLAASIILAIGSGCSQPAAAPTTHAAGGIVKNKNGRPLEGGTIQFQPVSGVDQTVVGTIASDGSFALATIVGRDKMPGAAEGTYKVTVIPPFGADQNIQPVTLRGPLTVQPNTENRFTITLPKGS